MSQVEDEVMKHTKSTLKDALTLTFVMIAALLAAEGRMPDFSKVAKFVGVYSALVVGLKIGHNDVAKQILTASAIGCGSKLMDILAKK